MTTGPFYDQNQVNDEAFTFLRNRTVRLEIPLYAPNPDKANRFLYARMDAEARDFSEVVGSGTGLKGMNHLDDVFPIDIVKTRDSIRGNALYLNKASEGIQRTSALYSSPAVQKGIGSLDNSTIAFWFKAVSLPTAGVFLGIILEREAGDTGEFSIKLTTDAGNGLGKIRVTHYPGTMAFDSADTAGIIEVGEWYYLVYTFDTAGGIGGKIYVAKAGDTTIGVVGSETLLEPITDTNEFIVGGLSLPGQSPSADIIIDDLQAWKVTFDQSTIEQMFKDYRLSRGRSTGRSVQQEIFIDDVEAHYSHIFGGGQQSGVTRRTEGRDVARQDNILTMLRYPGLDEKASIIVENIKWEIRYIQDAGGQGHHMQVFIREAKG